MRARGRIERSDRAKDRWVSLDALEPRVLLTFNPTADEQYMLELLNRFRIDPAAELAHMTSSLGNPARSNDPDIDSALRFFSTSGSALAAQWAQLVAAQPLAWNEDLYEAAEFHTQVMIDSNSQTHQAPGEPSLGARATNAGYTNYSFLAENVYAYARSVLHAHAGFAIDWGDNNDPSHPSVNGIQSPPGHRNNMLDNDFREVGIRILSESNSSTQVGPLLVTQDLGVRYNFGNSFLLGVVFADGGSNGYQPGEGLGGVSVQVVGAAGTYIATSMSAGGYQLQVPPGVYDITFSGAGFGSAATYRNITVGSQNVKLDGIKGVTPPAPEIAIYSGDGTGGAIEIVSGDRSPNTIDGTNYGHVNLVQSLTHSFTIFNFGTGPLQLESPQRVTIAGIRAERFTIVAYPVGLIMPGGSSTFSIRFDPVDTLLSNVTVTILNDDANEGEYTFKIKARGLVAPDIQVLGKHGTAILDGDSTPTGSDGTGFSSVNVANRRRVRDYTITNNGSAVLNLLSFDSGPSNFVRITGLNAGEYTVVWQPAASVQPGQTTTFRIRFNPSAEGWRIATVQVRSDDPDEGTFDFSVRGSGVLKPLVQVWGGDELIRKNNTPTIADGTDYGDRAVDGGRRLRTFTVVNNGSSPMEFTLSARTRVVVEGEDAASFKVMRQPRMSIPVGGSTVFKVRFDPFDIGLQTVRLVIQPINGSAFSFNISGTGV